MTMEHTQEAWKALGSQVEALGLKLKLHFEQEEGAGREAAAAGAKESFERVGEALEHVFEALGAATKDEALKADAKEAGRLLVDAVNATFTEASSELKDRINRH